MVKGYNSLLTPSRRINSSVVWHLTVDRDGKRISYNDGVDLSCLHNIDDAIFADARHFVGWLKSAEYLVGMFACVALMS